MSRKRAAAPRFFKPAARPPAPPREFELAVEKLSAEGRGLGFHQGKAVFAGGCLPGERVRVRVLAERREFIEAELVEVLRAAPQRQPPACALFGRCGGCQLQMLGHPAQLVHKQQVLERLLAPFGPLDWEPPLQAAPLHYRHRARLSVAGDSGGVPQLGFKSAHSHRVVAVTACPVLDARLQPLLERLPGWLAQLRHWRRLQEVLIAVADEGRLALRVEPALPAADCERLAQLAGGAGVDVDGDALPYPGAPALRFRPGDFTQVNPAVNAQLTARCAAWLQPQAGDAIADFFCGLGNFALALAPGAGRVLGYEGDAGMVARAAANAAAAGLDNARFEVLDLFAEALSLPRRFDKVLLDPPRAGARALCVQLARTPPARLVYVSCNPHTLVRDLEILVGGGLRLRRAVLVDMFPHTGHIEAAVLLER